MKTFKTLFAVLLIGSFVSCGSSRDTATNNQNDTRTDRLTKQRKSPSAINTDPVVQKETNAEMRRNTPGSDLENRSTSDETAEADANKKMFSTLGMNDSQIKQYRTQWNQARSDF